MRCHMYMRSGAAASGENRDHSVADSTRWKIPAAHATLGDSNRASRHIPKDIGMGDGAELAAVMGASPNGLDQYFRPLFEELKLR